MPGNNSFTSSAFATLDSLGVVARGVSVQVLRLDTFCPKLSGNKFFKLKHNIAYAKQQGIGQLISFGGAYSNHIHALAIAGQLHGLATIGVIRGERAGSLNLTLADAQAAGMRLVFVSREQYKKRQQANFHQQLENQFGRSLVIPEGGSNVQGISGCGEIIEHISHHINTRYDYLALACGTGATMAGVVAAAPEDKTVLGFPVLKGADFLETDIAAYIKAIKGDARSASWRLERAYHCGGYAKLNARLVDFVSNFGRAYNIALDHIYTGKLFMGLFDLIHHQAIPEGTRVIAIHTGGLQGERGMREKITRFQNLAANVS